VWKLALILLLLPPALLAQSRRNKAEEELGRVDSWESLDKWRGEYAREYDDGYLAEDIDEFVEGMLTHNWQSLTDLVTLSKSSPDLFKFSVNHLGEVTSCEGTKKILESAIADCPAGYEGYCAQIRHQLDTSTTATECRPAQLRPNKSFKPNPLRGSA
jgi:hypothetical protein